MDGWMVATMLEESAGVSRADRRDRCPQGFYQGFPGSGLCLSQDALDLRERFLDGIEVRRIWRQEEQLAAPSFDQFPGPLALMSAEVVHHDDLPTPQGRGEHSLDVSLEDRGGCGAFHRPAMPP